MGAGPGVGVEFTLFELVLVSLTHDGSEQDFNLIQEQYFVLLIQHCGKQMCLSVFGTPVEGSKKYVSDQQKQVK